jgi:hypothetical protein
MPSFETSMAVATVTLVTEKLNAKVKPSAIFVDNVNAGADASLLFQDVFTPSVTNLVPVPVLTTVTRLAINVAAGQMSSTMEDLLKDIDFIGTVQVVRSVLDANCLVTFIYKLV